MELNARIKNECRVCKRETNHIVKVIETKLYSSDDFSYNDDYAIVQCMGCDSLSFRNEYVTSESGYEDEDGFYNEGASIKIYPPMLNGHKRLDDAWLLPYSIQLMYNESIEALQSGCKVLAGAGFRAIIEAICLDKQITGRDLETKINNLVKNDLITKSERDRLHSIRFMGNDSIHEMKIPSDEQLKLVLYIVEHLISNIYLIDPAARQKLESVIEDYNEFKFLLRKSVKKLKSGEDLSLFKILGKDFRRVKESIHLFEEKLVEEIRSGNFECMVLGDIKPKSDGSKTMVQYFIIS